MSELYFGGKKKTVKRDISTYLVLNENTSSTCVQLIQLVIKTTC